MPGFYNSFRPLGTEVPPAQAPILTTTPVAAPISQPMSNMIISGGISKNVMDWSWLKNLGKVVIGAGIDALKGVLSSQQGNDSIDGVNIGTASGSSINNIGGALTPDIQGISLSNLLPKESKVDFNFKPFIPKQVKAKPPVYNFNTVDNQADNSFIASAQQQNQNIKQQQVKPPTERVIDTSQQKIYEEMARYAAHPRYNDYVNEFYAKNPESVTYSELAGLQSLRRSVEAGAYARKIIDINRAEAWQYFQNKYRTGGGGSEPNNAQSTSSNDIRESVKDVYNQSKNIAGSNINQFRPPKYDINKNIVDRNKAARISMPDTTKAFNQYLSGKPPFNSFNFPKSINGKYLYDGKIVSKEFFDGVQVGKCFKQQGRDLNKLFQHSPFSDYSNDSVKVGYRIAEGKNPWQGDPLKYVDAFDKSTFKMSNGDYVSSKGQIIKKEEVQSILWMESSTKKQILNTINARENLINNPNSEITVGQAGIKVNPTIDRMVKEGYFGNLKPYIDNKAPKDMGYVSNYLILNKEEAAAELIGAYKHKYRGYVDTSKSENMAFWAQLYNQGDQGVKVNATHTIPYDMYGMIVNRYLHHKYYNTTPKDPIDYKISGIPSYQEYKTIQEKPPWEYDKIIHWGKVSKSRFNLSK